MAKRSSDEEIPHSFKLLHTLRGHTSEVNKLAWSTDGCFLASASQDGTTKVWNIETGTICSNFTIYPSRMYSVSYSPKNSFLALGTSDKRVIIWNHKTEELIQELWNHKGNVYTVAWSPDGFYLATGAKDNNVILWNAESRKIHKKLTRHKDQVNSIAWSPDSKRLATCSDDNTVLLWDSNKGTLFKTLSEAGGLVSCISWSPNGEIIATSGEDGDIRLWNPFTGKQIAILEGHSGWVCSISFSYDSKILASKSLDNTVRLWRCDTWEIVAVLPEISSKATFAGLAFHPKEPILATLGDGGQAIRTWYLDFKSILNTLYSTKSVHYRNAKVVVVGDTGVGKSGLSLVLTGKSWIETGSTHGRHIWELEIQEIEAHDHQKEIHEILLWDLAGQPDYRLIHQLHLTEVTVALIVFDSRSHNDPFKGVTHWVRALRQAEKIQGNATSPIKKILVAARLDVARIGVSREQILKLKKDLDIVDYFETSAKEGWGISPLAAAIRKEIDWERLPKVSSNELFLSIKSFLKSEKESGRILSTADDLYITYLKAEENSLSIGNPKYEFITCVMQLESRGLIKRLSFGNLILLQPELLDIYASSMANAAKDCTSSNKTGHLS